MGPNEDHQTTGSLGSSPGETENQRNAARKRIEGLLPRSFRGEYWVALDLGVNQTAAKSEARVFRQLGVQLALALANLVFNLFFHVEMHQFHRTGLGNFMYVWLAGSFGGQ